MYNYYEVVRELQYIYTLLDTMFSYLKSVLTPILYVLSFAL